MKKHYAILLLVGLGLAGLIRWSQAALDRDRTITFVDRRPVFLPDGEMLKMMSAGYTSLIADWLWIQSVLYYGRRVMDEDNPYYNYAVHQGRLEAELSTLPLKTPVQQPGILSEGVQKEIEHLLYQEQSRHLVEYIYPLLDRVVTLDPHFVFPYLFGGVYVLMDTGNVDEALRLLKKGFEANPTVWQLPFYLGWVEWMYLGNEEATVDYLLKAVVLEQCPAFVSEILAGLSRDLGRSEATVLYLEGMLESSDNPRLRARIDRLIEDVGSRLNE
jgi:hypothetical protein